MHLNFFLFTAITLFMFSNASMAEDCYENASTTPEMIKCAWEERKIAMSALDSTHNKILSKTSIENKTTLKDARQAWEVFMQKQCEFDSAGAVGTSLYRMVVIQCEASMANDYRKLLLQQLNCEEGDISCGRQ